MRVISDSDSPNFREACLGATAFWKIRIQRKLIAYTGARMIVSFGVNFGENGPFPNQVSMNLQHVSKFTIKYINIQLIYLKLDTHIIKMAFSLQAHVLLDNFSMCGVFR